MPAAGSTQKPSVIGSGSVSYGGAIYSGTAVVPGTGGKTAGSIAQTVSGGGTVYVSEPSTIPSAPAITAPVITTKETTAQKVPAISTRFNPLQISGSMVAPMSPIQQRAGQISTTIELEKAAQKFPTSQQFIGQLFGTGKTYSQPDPFGAIGSLFKPIIPAGTSIQIRDVRRPSGTSEFNAMTQTFAPSKIIPVSSIIREQIMTKPELAMPTEAFAFGKAEKASSIASGIVGAEYTSKVAELQKGIDLGAITFEEATSAEQTIRGQYERKGQLMAQDIFTKQFMPEISAQQAGKAGIQSVLYPTYPLTTTLATGALSLGAFQVAPIAAGIATFGLGQIEGYRGISSGNYLQAGLGFGSSFLGESIAIRGVAKQITAAQISGATEKLRLGIDLRKTEGEYITDIYRGVSTTGTTEIGVKGMTISKITGEQAFEVVGGKFDLMGRTTDFYTGKDIFFGSGKIIGGGQGLVLPATKGYSPGIAELKSIGGYDFSAMRTKTGFKGIGKTFIKPSSEYVGGLTSDILPSGKQISYTGPIKSIDIEYNIGKFTGGEFDFRPSFMARQNAGFSFPISEKTIIKNVGFGEKGILNIGISEITSAKGIKANLPSQIFAQTSILKGQIPSLIPKLATSQISLQGISPLLKSGAILGLQTKTLAISAQKQALIPALSQVSLQKQDLFSMQKSIQIPFQGFESMQSLQSLQIQIQPLISQQKLESGLIQQPVKMTPFAPITPISPGFGGGLFFPPWAPSIKGFGLGTSFRGTNLGKQRLKYTPSLGAMTFGFKAPKISKFAITGISRRPIIAFPQKRKKRRKK